MSHLIGAGAVTAALVLLGLPLPAKADFKICNRTAESGARLGRLCQPTWGIDLRGLVDLEGLRRMRSGRGCE